MKYLNPFIVISLILLAALWPHVAWADALPSLFAVSDSDVAKKAFIDTIGGEAVGGKASMFGTLFFTFNSAVLILAGVYVAYTYIIGIAQGAHDGQFLGKRWSSMWIPIRMLVGAVLAFPSLKGGLCIAQWLVLWLSIQGIGFANLLWNNFVQNIGQGGVASPINSDQPYVIVRQMYLNNVCAGLFNKYAEDGGQGTPEEKAANKALIGVGNKVDVLVETTPQTDGLSRHLLYRLQGPLSATDNNIVCGDATFSSKKQTTAPMDIGNGDGATYDTNFTGDTVVTIKKHVSTAQDEISKAAYAITLNQYTQLGLLQTAIKPVADQYIIDGKDPTAKLQAIADKYQETINKTYTAQQQTLVGSGQSFAQQVKDDGFVMAGSYFMEAAKIRHTLAEAVNNFPHITTSQILGGTIDVNVGGGSGLLHWMFGNNDSNGQGFLMLMNQMRGDYDKAATQTKNSKIENSPYIAAAVSAKPEGFGSFIAKIFDGEEMNPSNLFVFGGDKDPLFMAIDLGNKLETMAWWVLGVGLAGSFLSGAIGSFAIAIWVALILPAQTLGLVIPMMPFIIWIMAVFSWFILLIEAFIAAPLWAVTHLNPEGGEGIQGKAGLGYSLILSLTLRPGLMVCGLACAIIAMQPIGEVISVTFGFAFNGAISGASGMKALSSMISGSILYAIVMFFVVSKVFELINMVPDRIMKWLGGTESGLDYSKEAAGVAMGTAYVAGRGIGNVAGKAMPALKGAKSGIGGGLQKLGDKIDGMKGKGGKEDGAGALGVGQGGETPDAPLPSSGNEGGTHNTPKPPKPTGGSGGGAGATAGAGATTASTVGKNSGGGSSRSSGGGSGDAIADLKSQQHGLYSQLKTQNPELTKSLNHAKRLDGQEGNIGVHGNRQSQIIENAIEEANTLKATGQPMTEAQETLVALGENREKIRGLSKKS